MRLFSLFFVCVVLMAVQSYASMPISSPWMADDEFQAAGACGGSWYNEGYHTTSSYFALDFNRYASCTSDDGIPIVAVANGRVVFSGWQSGFGNCVEIDHGEWNGKQVTSFYAHFKDGMAIPVKLQDSVVAGQVIGYCGMSGGTSTGEHLHFELREDGTSVRVTSMDEHDFCVQCEGLHFESLNHNIFDLEETADHGSENGGVHWWPEAWGTGDKYDGNNYAQKCYLQDYHDGSYGDCAIVYDALGGARKAYTVRTGMWSNGDNTGWSQTDGPQGSLGMPINDEYPIDGGARQDFQKGHLTYVSANGHVNFGSYAVCAPGWDDGWNNQYSYLFASAFERNGARVTVGYPSGYVYDYGPYKRQDYTGGTYGNCCIMYDPANAVGNAAATNEAYLLRGRFLTYYESQVRGGSASGCPTRDEYATGDPGDAIQFFFRMVDGDPQQHHMYYDASADTIGWNSTYATDYVSQNPAGQFTMQQGDARTFTVSFRNTSQFTWHNNAGNYPYDYVELKSCDASGATCESFLNYPYSGALNWLNSISPCTMQESSVAPGEVATFTFTGKVDENASTGLHLVYFRVNHSVGGLMEGWDGMHFQVNVVASLPEGYSDIVTVYDYGNQVTRIHAFVNDGDEFDYQGSAGWWQKTGYIATKLEKSCAGDFDGDGYSDMAAIYDYPGTAARIHVWLSTGSGLDYQDDTGWWLSSDYETDNVVHMLAGDFNEDGKDDIAIVYRNTISTTRVHVWLSTGTSFTFQGSDGWWYQTAYHADDVVHAVAGDFDNDGDDDIALMYDYGSGQTRIHMLLSSGSDFSWTGSTGWWLVTGYTATNVKHMVAGNFNGSGGWDIAMLYYYGDGLTRLHMLLSTGSAFSYQGSSGWWSRTGYNGNNVIFAAPGYFDDDNLPDVVLAYRYGASSTRFHVLLSTGSAFVYQGDTGWWLSTSYSLDSTVHLLAGHFNEESSRAYKQVSDDGSVLPSVFSLSQNYPNPFNPVTFISYSLPLATDVKLDIFNILGQKVTTLVNGSQEAGEHIVHWDASSVASGIYFYRIQTAEAVETKKMLLLK